MFSALLFVVVAAASPHPHATPHATPHAKLVVTPTPLPTPLTWMGLTLGGSEAEALSRLGDAAFVSERGSASFVIDHAHGILDIGVHAGRITDIAVRQNWRDFSFPSAADPFGITIGATEADVTSKRGNKFQARDANGRHFLTYTDPSGMTWEYMFFQNQDKVRSIWAKMSDAQIAALSPLAEPVAHGGTSFDDAVMDLASDEQSGAQNEEDFLLSFSCPAGNGRRGMWREDAQRLVEHGDRKFDVLHLHCNMTDATRDLYFDVTSFFGKM